MAIGAGYLNSKATFLRRVDSPSAPNTLRGTFQEFGYAVWGHFREVKPVDKSFGNAVVQLRTGILTIRDNGFAQTLTSEMRCMINGETFEIQSLTPPMDRNGDLRVELVAAPTRASYAREFNQRGETVTVTRLVPNQPSIQKTARAIITGYEPDELIGGINQGDRKIILSAEDLETAGFPLPLKENSTDRVIVRGRTLMIAAIDDSTHRVAGVLNAYQIRATG